MQLCRKGPGDPHEHQAKHEPAMYLLQRSTGFWAALEVVLPAIGRGDPSPVVVMSHPEHLSPFLCSLVQETQGHKGK